MQLVITRAAARHDTACVRAAGYLPAANESAHGPLVPSAYPMTTFTTQLNVPGVLWGMQRQWKDPVIALRRVRSMVHGDGAEDASTHVPGVHYMKHQCWDARIDVLGAGIESPTGMCRAFSALLHNAHVQVTALDWGISHRSDKHN